jgi:hypothetical protein
LGLPHHAIGGQPNGCDEQGDRAPSHIAGVHVERPPLFQLCALNITSPVATTS